MVLLRTFSEYLWNLLKYKEFLLTEFNLTFLHGLFIFVLLLFFFVSHSTSFPLKSFHFMQQRRVIRPLMLMPYIFSLNKNLYYVFYSYFNDLTSIAQRSFEESLEHFCVNSKRREEKKSTVHGY